MERYLVELTGDQLDRLNGMVREAINAAEDENKRELEDLLSALHDIRGWREHLKRSGPPPRAQSQSRMRPGTRTADNRPARGSLLGVLLVSASVRRHAPVCSAFTLDSM